MIVTLTTHPSLDRTVTLAEPLRPGQVQTATSVREDAGGKGINVARVAAAAGAATVAVLPLAEDDPFSSALHAAHITTSTVPIGGHCRANLTIADLHGVTTKINLPGPALSAQDAQQLVDAVVAAGRDADWIVLAGSLAPGLPDDFYAEVIRSVRAAGGASAPRIAVDTSGPALTATVHSARPDLIKPNEEELADLTGRTLDAALDSPQAIADLAREIVPRLAAAALVTLGSRGALYIDHTGAWSAAPPPTHAISTVGAGDSALAGFLLADVAGRSPQDGLRQAIRYGSAAASLPGTQPPTPADLPLGAIDVVAL